MVQELAGWTPLRSLVLSVAHHLSLVTNLCGSPLFLGKWPSGHVDTGKASLVAQRALEASERGCGAEVGPESQEIDG